MATSRLPQLGGYQYEFLSLVPDKWTCPVCHLPLNDPVQVFGCGHRFCQLCIDSVLSCGPSLCPVDRQPIFKDKVFPDAGCQREIMDLHVKCQVDNCPWTGELRHVGAHEKECLYELVPCTNNRCKKQVAKQRLEFHLTSECKWRIITCEYCRESMPNAQEKTHLIEVCLFVPVECQEGCGRRDIPRKEMENHISKHCPLTAVTCEYQYLGCSAKFKRGELENHMDSNMRSHLDLACKKIQKDEDQRAEQGRRMEEAERKIETLLKNVEILSQKTKSLEADTQNCKLFTWKVQNLQAFLNEARKGKEVMKYSRPFYLQGYRMFVVLSPIRYSYSTGFLSLSYGVTKGKLDDVVTWPFKCKVSFTLVDQGDGLDKKDIVKYSTPPAQGVPRPKDERYAASYGGSDFVSHFVLFSRSYIKKDAVVIEVELDGGH